MGESCRICFSTDNLVAFDTILYDDTTYEDVFYYCTQLERDASNQYIKICASCKDELQNIYNFIEKAKIAWHNIESKDDILENFDVEVLEDKIVNDEVICEVDEEQKCSEDASDKLYESNENSVSNLSDDVDCKAELYLETNDGNATNYDGKHINGANTDFACRYCGKHLSNSITKSRHIKLMHEVSAAILCDECPRTFKSKIGLAKHRKVHQQNRERKYACKYCELKFFSSANCRSHESTHDVKREKKYKCDQCEKAFFQIGSLNVHKRMHQGQMVECVICRKSYPRLIDLQIHMRTHTNDRPYTCDLCKKTFINRSTLSEHVKKEHLGFVYKCNICSKRFKDQELLQQHSAVHNTFPFVCAICNDSFVKRFFLHRHLKRVHDITKEADLRQLVLVVD